MKTTKELVDDALAKAGLSPTELGNKLGYKNGFQGYYKMFVSHKIKFTDDRQKQVEEILGLPYGHFQSPDMTVKRELYIKRTFQEFLRTDVARALDEQTIRTIERIPFAGDRLPTIELYQAIALAMGGHYSTQQLDAALKMNEDVDREQMPSRSQRPVGRRPRK